MATYCTYVPNLVRAESGLNRLMAEIREQKQQVKIKFVEFREMVDTREREIIEKFDGILATVKSDIAEQRKQIEELQDTKTVIEGRIASNKNKLFKSDTIEGISAKISELENELLPEIPSTKLCWNLGILERAIKEMCQVEKRPCPYEERFMPVLACGNKGKGERQIISPTGVAIDEDNGDIYVADCEMHRIQIFTNNGEYKTSIGSIGYYPRRLVLDNFHCYVTCNVRDGALVKITKTNKQTKEIEPGEFISDIAIDSNNRLIGTSYDKPNICVWDKDLVKKEVFTLYTDYFETGKTQMQKVVPRFDTILVLFTGSDYPIQSFSWNGRLQRTIVFKDEIAGAKMFTLDREGKLLVVNNKKHEVKIFSPEGKNMATIGEEGKGEGKFSNPLSLAATCCGRMLVLDMKTECMIQMF